MKAQIKSFKMSSNGVEKEALNLYPSENQIIGYCESGNNVVESNALYQTIIVMDRSGSMGSEAQRLVQEIFPLFLKKLSYKPENLIHLITFDSSSELNEVTLDELPDLNISARGSTLMRDAVELCSGVFSKFDNKKPVRLLTISDGEIYDQLVTSIAAASLNNFLKSFNPSFKINSKAVRLFTSDAQPDTKAISSLLQINNGPSKSLVDIPTSESDEVIAQKIADLFLDDNFDRLRTVSASKPVFKQFPWDDQASSNLTLTPGENVFWMTEMPQDELKDNGSNVKAVNQPQLDADRFEILIRSKFDEIIEKLKVYQIVDTFESRETIIKITKYFKETLTTIPAGERNKSEMAVFNEIERVASDQSVKHMNPQEKADYLCKKIILPPLGVESQGRSRRSNNHQSQGNSQGNTNNQALNFLDIFRDFVKSLYDFICILIPADNRINCFFVLMAIFSFFVVRLLWIKNRT